MGRRRVCPIVRCMCPAVPELVAMASERKRFSGPTVRQFELRLKFACAPAEATIETVPARGDQRRTSALRATTLGVRERLQYLEPLHEDIGALHRILSHNVTTHLCANLRVAYSFALVSSYLASPAARSPLKAPQATSLE